jgi:hypothetical protein
MARPARPSVHFRASNCAIPGRNTTLNRPNPIQVRAYVNKRLSFLDERKHIPLYVVGLSQSNVTSNTNDAESVKNMDERERTGRIPVTIGNERGPAPVCDDLLAALAEVDP